MKINETSKELHILLVEDDDGDAQIVQDAFKKEVKIPYKIIRALDGVEALEMLRGANGKMKVQPPYLLLVDLSMPGMNGIELIQTLREDPELSRTLCFVLTTFKREENSIKDMKALNKLSIAGYIVKSEAGADFMKLVGLIKSYANIIGMPNKI